MKYILNADSLDGILQKSLCVYGSRKCAASDHAKKREKEALRMQLQFSVIFIKLKIHFNFVGFRNMYPVIYYSNY